MKVCNVFPYYGTNGIYRYVDSLNEGLVSLEKDIEILNFIVLDKTSSPPMSKNRNEYTVCYRDLSVSLERKNLLADCSIPELEKSFEKFLIEKKPDVINFHHLSNLGASLVGVAKDKGIPTVFTLHDYWSICPRHFLVDRNYLLCDGPNMGSNCVKCYTNPEEKNIYEEMQKSIVRYQYIKDILRDKVDICISVSNSVRDKMISEGFPASKIKNIYPALPLYKKIKKNSKCRNEKIVFGFIGGLYIIKGPHVVIDAFNLLESSKAELHLYGMSKTPFKRTVLEAMAGENPSIVFKGEYSSEDLEEIFESVDILIVPSICPETGPLVVQEALRHGIPVIGSRIGGIPEYISDEHGALFESGDSIGLSEIMNNILQKPEMIFEWTRKIPELYTVQDFSKEVHEVYRNITRPKKLEHSSNHIDLLKGYGPGFMRRESIAESLPLQIDKIVTYIKENSLNSVAIFGSGQLGGIVAKKLQELSINVVYFIDNDEKKWGKYLHNIKIMSPQITADSSEIQSVIIVSDWEDEIMKQLKEMKINLPIIGLYDFS